MKHIRQAAAQFAAMVSIVALALCGGGCPGVVPADTYIRAAVGDGPIRKFPRPLARLELVDGFLDIQGHQPIDTQTEELLSLHLPHPRKGARWSLGASGSGAGWAAYFVRNVPADETRNYHTDKDHAGTAVLTGFDPKLHIAEGTFEFDGALVRGASDTLRVRRGSFRVRYEIVPADAYDHRSRD